MRIRDEELNLRKMDIILARTNTRYEGNIRWKREPEYEGNWIHFTLTVKKSADKGGRRSSSGRRVAAACWHVHRDFMYELFNWFPEADLKTALANYYGMKGFLKAFPGTGLNNIGSEVQPMRMRDACDCAEEQRGDDFHNTPQGPIAAEDVRWADGVSR